MTAGRQLLDLLREYEQRRMPQRHDNTPRGVAESLRGDRHHPEVLDDAEIIEGLADQLGMLDLDLAEVYGRLS